MMKLNSKYQTVLSSLDEHVNYHKDSNVLLIDGLNTFIRAWSVNPSLNENGDHIGGVVGFFKSIGFAIKELTPTRCIVVFDGRGGSLRRRKLYPQYKENRKNKLKVNRAYELLTDEDERASMKRQLLTIAEMLKHLPVTVLALDNIEADDSIAYLTTHIFTQPDTHVTIMSSDKDFLQLVTDRVFVWSPTKKILYDPSKVFLEYGLPSKNFLLTKVLGGDKSDNIDGIRGAGTKTIIKRFPILLREDVEVTIDDLLEFAESCVTDKSKIKLYKSVLDDRELLERNYKLMQLHDVDVSASSKFSILASSNMKVSKLDKTHLLLKMQELDVLSGFPHIHTRIQDVFVKLNNYAGD